MFKRTYRGIRAKLLLGYVLVIAVFIAAIAGNTLFQGKVTMLTEQVNRNYSKLSLVQQLTDKIRQADGYGARYVMSNTDDERTSYLSSYEAVIPEITEAVAGLKNAGLNEAESGGITQLENEWSNYLAVLEDAFAQAKEGNFPGAQKAFTNLSLDTIIESQLVFENVLGEEIAKLQKDAQTHRSTAMAISLGVTGLSVVLAVSIALLLAARITRPLHDMNKQLQEIADGEADLTRKLTVRTKDEIGALAANFNKMTANLGELIGLVGQSAGGLADASAKLTADSAKTAGATEQIAGIMGTVAEGTDRQMNDLQLNMTTMTEMSAGIRQVAVSMQRIAEASQRSADFAVAGDDSLKAADRQMESITHSIGTLSRQVLGFVNRSQDIGSMVAIIKDIAAQTNMLALNAAIEAARAGEQGRGFAVVADQVRRLAEQSGDSASRIAQMAAEIQADADHAVQVMRGSMEEVQSGTQVISAAGQSFAEIRSSIDSLAGQVEEVSGAVEEMTAATEEIASSIRHVTGISETTSAHTRQVSAASREQMAAVEQIATSAHSLSGLAQGLQALVARFNI
ncbi:methyl-accepting chemotaxis protein [Paenibacillus tengchongensis]|uniref:methyl-accepting chemotaxis protein n=1 Tax=Paenibacillus tengchongensis TaxID=2608684 RepID=UPI00124E755E|nr:methyl-accepting chemotaxis protein [Paenibacillus tengchongensis]